MATWSALPASESGDNIAFPAVPYCAMHVLRDGTVAVSQAWRQHDGSAVLGRKLITGVCRDASHTAFFINGSVNQDVILADLDDLLAYIYDHCMAHARQYARQITAATAAALYEHNDPYSTEVDVELSAAYAPDYMGAAAWNCVHTQDAWYSFARTCHDTALSHCVHPKAAPTHTVPVVVGHSERATSIDIGSGNSASALVRRGLPLQGWWQHFRKRQHDTHAAWMTCK